MQQHESALLMQDKRLALAPPTCATKKGSGKETGRNGCQAMRKEYGKHEKDTDRK